MAENLSDQELMEIANSQNDLSNISDQELMQIAGEDYEFSASNMVQNIPGSALQLGKDLFSAVSSPIDTAKSLGSVAGGLTQVAADNDKGVTGVGLIGRVLDAYDIDVRESADAVWDGIMARYGSKEKALKTIENDPVGFAVDLSALVAPLRPKLSAAINPVNVGKNTVKTAVAKATPKSVPVKMMESATKFSTTLPEAQRAALTKTMLKYGIKPSAAGVDLVAGKVAQFNRQIDNLITGAEKAGKSVPRSAVYKNLKELRRNTGGVELDASKNLRMIDAVVKQFETHLDDMGKSRLTPKDLQNLKVKAYKSINFDRKQNKLTPIKEDTFKAIAKGAKENIEDLAPGTKEANRALGELLDLDPKLQQAVGRIDNRNILPLEGTMNTSAGAVMADVPGAAAGATLSILGMPRAKAWQALRLYGMQEKTARQIFMANYPSTSAAQLALIIEGREPTESDQQP